MMGKMIKELTHMYEDVVLKLILFYNRYINCTCIDSLLFQEFVCPSLQRAKVCPISFNENSISLACYSPPGLFLTLGYLSLTRISLLA